MKTLMAVNCGNYILHDLAMAKMGGEAHRRQGQDVLRRVKGTNMKTAAVLVILTCAVQAFGRGEWCQPKPPQAPAVATLTNETRYIEWKWRTDVTDPSTGVDNAAATEAIVALAKELEPKEPWNVVKASCFAWLCDNLAIDVSPFDWYPAFACWDRLKWPMRSVVGPRNGRIAEKFYPEIAPRIDRGNREGWWMVWKDFDHIIPDWDNVVLLGFPGMRRRLEANWQDSNPYYRAERLASDAIFLLLDRLIAQGEKRQKGLDGLAASQANKRTSEQFLSP